MPRRRPKACAIRHTPHLYAPVHQQARAGCETQGARNADLRRTATA